VGGFLLSTVLFLVVALVLWRTPSPPDPVSGAQLQTVTSLIAFGLFTWLIGFRVARLDAAALRWRPDLRCGLGRGLALGAAPALAALSLAVPLARAGWSGDGGSPGAWLASAGGLAVLLGPAALVEEVIFRGVPLVLLAGAFSRATAVVGLAVVFGLAHLLNPGITPLAAGNIALAGVFLGTAFYLPGGLWSATGAHVGWNLTLAALAAPVSGLPLPVAGLDYRPGEPAWLTGGSFGPEGGLLATLVLGVVTLFAARRMEPETRE
jgi:hypothetical protein